MQEKHSLKFLKYRDYRVAIVPDMPHISFIQRNNIDKLKVKELSEYAIKHTENRIENTTASEITFVKIYLYLTNSCNLNCAYCFRNEFDELSNFNVAVNKKSCMTENVIRLLQILKYRYVKLRSVVIQFYGGEPLLKFDEIYNMVMILNEVKQKFRLNIHYGINTNGTLLTADIADFFIKNNFTTLISLDGREGYHDTVRPYKDGKHSHKVIVSNIKNMLEKINEKKIKRCLVVNTTLSENNMDILDICKYYSTIGIQYVTYGPILGCNLQDDYFVRLKFEYDRLFDAAMEDINSFRFHKKMNLYYFRYVSNIKKCIPGSLLKDYPACKTGIGHFTLTVNGNLSICPVLCSNSKFILGNIYETIHWNSIEGLQSFSAESDDFCSKCWIRRFCGGGCFANNFKNNHNLFIPDNRMCDLNQYIVLQSIILFAYICKKNYVAFFKAISDPFKEL